MNIGIIAAGSMGAALGRVLAAHGATIITTLEGRSEATRARAHAAGMTDAPPAAFGACDVILSVVPPDEALPLARLLAPILETSAKKPLYVDCNAIAPSEAKAIGEVVAAAGCPFVDTGIVGGAPNPDGTRIPAIYASGPHAERFAMLRELGLDIRVLDAPNGAASALKMAIAGVSKSMTGVVALMAMSAREAGVEAAFLAQLRQSQPGVAAFAGAQIRALPEKAYRWVPEMEALAALAAHPGGPEVYRGLAALYDWIAREHSVDPDLKALIERFSRD
ncbi:MAG: NAD(P)-dependent oxidoreductase [Hyphomonadaceae bacterium]|nr:NAD(P)-dependent oxidoreductase [Hyphomonadaceae bacterium]